MFHALFHISVQHETTMTCHRIQTIGAYTTRQGTASLGRIEALGSIRRLPCVHALIANVTPLTRSHGGRKP